MPAQKRSLPDDDETSPPPPDPPLPPSQEEEGDGGGEVKLEQPAPPNQQQAELPKEEEDSEDEEAGSGSEKDEGDETACRGHGTKLPFFLAIRDPARMASIEKGRRSMKSSFVKVLDFMSCRFVFVKLADIRKEVQCPICLGIIRKTRTVMECLHRFCRECIDKSMRLGNNECPACRTHCASRRSLRDDPNYDALIAALYPDIDKYEEEDLAFHEEEKNRNKKIQASIAETFRRQSEALGRRKTTARATAAAFARKSQYRSSHGQNSYLRGRGRSSVRDTSLAVSEDEEEEDANGNDGKESSSADEPSPDRRQKRCRRWPVPRSSPARTAGYADIGGEENDDVETSKDNRGTSPLRVGNREMLAWGRGGVRSQIRHGNSSGANGRFIKGGRITKLVEYIRNLEENENEFDIHLTLLPVEEQSGPNIQRPYICCQPTLSVRQLCQFIALQASVSTEQVEIFARKSEGGNLELKPSTPVVKVESDPLKDLQIVGAQESLSSLCDSFTNCRGDLVLVYRLKTQS